MTSKSSYLLLATGLPVAGLVAWQLGARSGAGALLGVLAATFVSALGLAWSERARRLGRGRPLEGVAFTFLAKLGLLGAGALCLRFIPAAGEIFDWSAYLLGFAAAVLWAMLATSLPHLRSLRPARSSAQ
ncbi:MAG: hypothetical protein FJ298_11890 [Planctomycetes bacterium]|nr:hypothetical protein [Planctomycetota bacterium]